MAEYGRTSLLQRVELQIEASGSAVWTGIFCAWKWIADSEAQ